MSQEALQTCIRDEQTYQFTHFSHRDAWELGHALVSACEQMGAPLAVEIEVNHVIVFRYYRTAPARTTSSGCAANGIW